jgi:hypothetical protein
MVKKPMKNPGLLILSLWFAGQVPASGMDPAPGARNSAMGGCGITAVDLWSVSTNQAGLAWFRGWATGIYAGNQFLVSELSTEAVAVSWSGKPGAFGLMLSYSGYRLFGEMKAGLAYARKFGKRFSAGLQLNYNRIQIGEGYGSAGMVSCEAGFLYKPGTSWILGVQVCNPVPVKFSGLPSASAPFRFRFGIGYSLRDKAYFTAEAEKEPDEKLVIRAGTEIRLVKPVCIRFGVGSSPFSVTSGFGFRLGKLQVDLATAYHMILGFSPSLSVQFCFGNN